MPQDCLFCKIASGDMDAYTVYEDENVKAFLDINPVSQGHTLVIPKSHAPELTDLEVEDTARVFMAVRTIAEVLDAELEPAGINILQSNRQAAGQEIGHMHVHIIPRYAEDGFAFQFQSGQLDEKTAGQLQERVRGRLG